MLGQGTVGDVLQCIQRSKIVQYTPKLSVENNTYTWSTFIEYTNPYPTIQDTLYSNRHVYKCTVQQYPILKNVHNTPHSPESTAFGLSHKPHHKPLLFSGGGTHCNTLCSHKSSVALLYDQGLRRPVPGLETFQENHFCSVALLQQPFALETHTRNTQHTQAGCLDEQQTHSKDNGNIIL